MERASRHPKKPAVCEILSNRGLSTMKFAVLTVAALLPAFAQTPAPKVPVAKVAAKKSAPARTPDGHPDLQGIWTNATLTTMERPAALKDKPFLTAKEAADWAKKQNDEVAQADGKADADFHRRAGSGETGGYNAVFIDRGSELASVDGQYRTSLVIDPPDGHVPPPSAEALARRNARGGRGGRGPSINSAKERPLSERCLMSFGSSSGPPM